jgi:ferredoxin-NADP reductase
VSVPPPWDKERDDMLVCAGVRQETADVSTFVLKPEQPRLFQFLPGQFMTFELEPVGLQRCYTIASPPTRPYRIEITAKRSGPGSSWVHETLRPGLRVRVNGPSGDFSFGAKPSGRFLFLAAGSGITPLMSMARTAHDLGSDADILLVQSARSPADLLFPGELAAMSARPGFRTAGIIERDGPGADWDGLRGRLSAPMLSALAPDLLDREVFCCGPAPYMASVRAMLDAAGFDMRRYYEESFTFAAGEAEPPAAANVVPLHAPAGGFNVVFSQSGRTIACAADSSVLNAARAAGVRLPSACGKGMCGTCKSRMLSGTVEMRHGGGIRQREIDAGMVLLCCARPTSDLVVER